jgi:signal transduction histidine kinase
MDAMSSGGRIIIRSSPSQAAASNCAFRLTVADTGTGIEPQQLRKIFEPFFTSGKEVGTGLGLWITRELVEKHKGKIKVRSRKNQGTVFSIVFPCDSRATRELSVPVLQGPDRHAPGNGGGR